MNVRAGDIRRAGGCLSSGWRGVSSSRYTAGRVSTAFSTSLTVSDSTPKVVLIAVFGISLLANFASKHTVAA